MDFVAKSFNFDQGDRCVVIGEIGVNHNKDLDTLMQLIDEGASTGVDIIKLQRFNAALEISSFAGLADYQKKAGMSENQLKMAQALELTDEMIFKGYEYCKKKGVGFLCTAFEHESVDFLADKLGCKSLKIPSPEISNKPLLQQMARKFDSLLISTGASYLEDVDSALGWIAEAGHGRHELALMHCTSQYPAALSQANLRAIETMRNHFDRPTGYSDHTVGHTAAAVACTLGGVVVEKHFTLDKTMPGPDHQASVDIVELRKFVEVVREASVLRDPQSGLADISQIAHLVDDLEEARGSIGDGVKRPTVEEEETRPKIRKSIVCGVPTLHPGNKLENSMLEIKRPWVEGAVEPFELEELIGMTLTNEKRFDEPIFWSDVE